MNGRTRNYSGMHRYEISWVEAFDQTSSILIPEQSIEVDAAVVRQVNLIKHGNLTD
jgi:hypothetical protein